MGDRPINLAESDISGRRVLVAGGSGFLGTNLIARLLSKGCRIRATLHERPAVIQSDAVEYVKADLRREEDCRRVVEGIDEVYMCAANTSGAGVIATTPLVHVTPNVVMNAQMLEASYVGGVKKFLFVSSSVVYPPTGDRPVAEEEAFDGDPDEVYYSAGWMKRYAEILCRIYAEKLKRPMTTVVLRLSNAYGPYDKFDFRTSHMLAALLRRVVERQDPIEVWGSGNDVKDLIYVNDVVDAMFLAMEKLTAYVPLNIGFGRGYSVREVLQTILEVDGYADAKVVFDPLKPTMIPIRLVDTRKAEAVLGFKATTGLREGIEKTISWYRSWGEERVSRPTTQVWQ